MARTPPADLSPAAARDNANADGAKAHKGATRTAKKRKTETRTTNTRTPKSVKPPREATARSPRRLERAAPRKGGGASDSAGAVAIRLYDFQNLPFLPADAVADPARDPLHGGTYALMRDVLDFWESALGRRSYDGAGRRVVMFLRYPSGGGYCDPELEALRFSGPWLFDGADGRRYYFGDFALSADYVAHEFAHAVTNYCARLDYREAEQAGLHESLSDCFAIAFRNWRARRTDPAAPVEWRFGAGVALPPLSCTRNLAEPNDPRAWSRGFSHASEVHPGPDGRIDAYAIGAVASLAFRRLAQALGEDVMAAARLWHAALSDPRVLGVKSFGAFADLTVLCAQRAGVDLERAARGAWASVGIGVSVAVAV